MTTTTRTPAFTRLAPGIATGAPVPPGWQSIVESPLLILVGVTGVGKSTTIQALQAHMAELTQRPPTLLPDRRDITDQLIIGSLQQMDGLPVTYVSDRQARFEYTRRYRSLFAGGMAHALTQLWLHPAELNEPPAGGLLLFDGLRGANEVLHAAQLLPAARFLVLDAPDVVRVRRLIGRGDVFDRVVDNVGHSTAGRVRSFAELGLDAANATDANMLFHSDEEYELLELVNSGEVAAADLRTKLQIVLSERRNYDPQATIAALQTVAPSRTLVIDTTVNRADEIVKLIISHFV